MVGNKPVNNILKDLIPLAQRGKVTRFLTSAEDADKLSSTVIDEYPRRDDGVSDLTPTSYFVTAGHLS